MSRTDVTTVNRPRQSRALAAIVYAGLTACGAPVVGGVSETTSSPPVVTAEATLATDGSVPFVEEAAGDHEFDTPVPPEPTRGDARPCTAQGLTAEMEKWYRPGNGGEPGVRHSTAGNLIGSVRMTPRAGAPCTLQGAVSARLRVDGKVAPLHYDSGGVTDESLQRVIVVDGRSLVDLRVGWHPPYCGPSGVQELVIDLPGDGSELTAPVRVPDAPACSKLDVEGDRGLRGSFGAGGFETHHAPTTQVSPLAVLVATAEGVPPSTAAGQVVEYRVRLTNPTAHAVALAPCPGFGVQLFILGVGDRTGFNTGKLYRLNCRPVTSVPAGGSVVFQMRAQVPQDPPGGPDLVVKWTLASPYLAQATTLEVGFRVVLQR